MRIYLGLILLIVGCSPDLSFVKAELSPPLEIVDSSNVTELGSIYKLPAANQSAENTFAITDRDSWENPRPQASIIMAEASSADSLLILDSAQVVLGEDSNKQLALYVSPRSENFASSLLTSITAAGLKIKSSDLPRGKVLILLDNKAVVELSFRTTLRSAYVTASALEQTELDVRSILKTIALQLRKKI